jgi:hypothetical protein
MKQSRKEPVFLLEMPHQLRHIIMKRSHMLRACRTRTLFNMGKGGPKSWLQAKLIPAPGESTLESWDKAHELAEKFKRELHQDVFVEPGSRAGRFHSMIEPEARDNQDQNRTDHPFLPDDPIAHTGFAHGPLTGVTGIGGGFGMGSNRSSMGFGAGMGVDIHMPGAMGHQNSGLPPEVEALMANRPATNKSEFTCPAVRELSGWSELPQSRQQMFETEAAQLIKNGLSLDTSGDLPHLERSTLALVRLQPNVSKMLKHFLDEALLPKTTD